MFHNPYPFPNAPSRTYNQGGAPNVQADDLNDFMTALQYIWGSIIGRGSKLFREEFLLPNTNVILGGTGDVFGQFYVSSRVGSPRLRSNLSPPADGSMGVLSIQTSNGNAASVELDGNNIGIGTREFVMSIRCRIALKAALDSSFAGFGIGLAGTGGSAACSFGSQVGGSQANWQFSDHAANLQDTGVAVSNGQDTDLQAIRFNGVTSAYINGNLVYSGADVANYSNAYPIILVNGLGGQAVNQEYAAVDNFKLLVIG